MRVKISRSYSSMGEFNLDKFSNKNLGSLIRIMLSDIADDPTNKYPRVELEVVREKEESDGE